MYLNKKNYSMAALGQLTVLTAPTRSFHCEARGVPGLRGRGDVVVLKAQCCDFIQKEKACNFYFCLILLIFRFGYLLFAAIPECIHICIYSYKVI